ncbi:serine hydrolase [Treponema sp.]|uniref:serine hydrolase domain-containing protein n=1 Tax=Treponema sp. TaxID=166 RepID=UPI00298E7874|nr:serine hydrolase [Treponema sp.]MCR5613682.1 beta-lactamase family protein [Treponema sp.]
MNFRRICKFVFLNLIFCGISFSQVYENSNLEKIFKTFPDTEITSCVVLKNGARQAEYFKTGYNRNSIFSVQSVSKSITSAIVGIALEEKLIPGLDTPIVKYFPELAKKSDRRYSKITIRHLLNNTSGLTSTDSSLWMEWRNSANWIEWLFSKPMVHEPGTVFDYSTGNTHLLSAIIQRVTGKTLYEYGKEKLFDKAGMKTVICEQDAQGICDGGNGFLLSAYDMAFFGQLYLNGGKSGNVQIVPEPWIKDSTKRQTDGARYGFQWWQRNFGKKGYASFFAHGWGEQVIAVIPSAGLVITFTSRYPDNRKNQMYWKYISDIVDALEN